MNEDKLYIPANVKTRLEFFKGFGVQEMIATVIVAIFSIPFCFLIYSLKGTSSTVLFFLILVAGTIMSVTKDEHNLCIASQVKYLIKGQTMQRKFIYSYFDKRRAYVDIQEKEQGKNL